MDEEAAMKLRGSISFFSSVTQTKVRRRTRPRAKKESAAVVVVAAGDPETARGKRPARFVDLLTR